MTIQKNLSLKPYNTFGIDVSAAHFADVFSVEELKTILSDAAYRKIPKLILGGGSNVLFSKNVDALVILNQIKGIEIIKEDDDYVFIRSGAGEAWNDLVMYAVAHNYGGIENLSLIPGSVGAAPMQNIGAYGVELKETFVELEAIDIETAEQKSFVKEECKFGYRESIFKHEAKGKYIIISVTLQLNKNPVFNTSYGAIEQELQKMNAQPNIKNISEAVCNIRRGKLPDPAKIGNAGSFFKNPTVNQEKFEKLKSQYPTIPNYATGNSSTQQPNNPTSQQHKIPAGWLIEQCGWKGKRVGNTGAHKDQALVLVNYGNATGEEIIALAKQIQQSVKEKFDVDILPEVNVY